jgi:hypothetical protein
MSGIEQIGIAVFGVAAIRLSQDARRSVQRWACVAGLCAQPFWFYATYSAQQWGIFGLCFFYTWAWARGIRTYWIAK